MKWNTFHGFTLQFEELLNYGFCEQRKFPNSLTRQAFVWYNTNLRPNLSKLGQKWKKNSRHFALIKLGVSMVDLAQLKTKSWINCRWLKKELAQDGLDF